MSSEDLSRIFNFTPKSVAALLMHGGCGWIAEINGIVVGFSLADTIVMELAGLSVLPEYEGRGIGTSLLQHAVDWLCEQGLKEITIDTDADPTLRANLLYRSFGATLIRSVYPGHFRYSLKLPARKVLKKT